MKHYHVKTREEAWILANQLFPYDYMENIELSRNAGYPIYWTTYTGSNAYISDLSVRIELNLYLDGKEDITIWIDEDGSALTEEVKPSAGDTWNRENVSISYRTREWYKDAIQNTI